VAWICRPPKLGGGHGVSASAQAGRGEPVTCRREGLVSIRCLKKRGMLVVREVPVPPALIEELAHVHPLHRPDVSLWPWGRTTTWRFIKTVMSAAGTYSLPATPKGPLHGFGVLAAMCGVPLNIIQKWLGQPTARRRDRRRRSSREGS
jgi:hypothetical protein